MRRHITIKIAVCASFVLSFLLLGSCTGDFEKFNRHPTNPTTGDMTEPEKVGSLLSPMLYLMHNTQENQSQHIEQFVGNQYGGYMTTSNQWNGTNFGTMNPSYDWIARTFNDTFSDFYSNYYEVKKITGSRGYIYHWANIIRVAVMHRVVDTYGPIPYSQTTGEQLTVGYDSVEEVYHNMLADLQASVDGLVAFVAENPGTDNPMAEFDLVYGGDFGKWIKFANSLRLRLAIRIAHKDIEYARPIIQAAVTGGCIESNTDNAFLPAGAAGNSYYKAAVSWHELPINATLACYMNGFEDPRISAYMTRPSNAAAGGYLGVQMGINNVIQDIYGFSAFVSLPNFTASSPLLVLCAAETSFLKAEAALKGWISGDPADFYENGIRLSMAQWGVTSGIDAYLEGTTPPQNFDDPYISAVGSSHTFATNVCTKWENSDSETLKLEKIITQKWLANYTLGFEGWAEFRRTGYPEMIPARNNLSTGSPLGTITNSSKRLVRRLVYPRSEYDGNPNNLNHAVQNLLGGDDAGATDIWWALP